jgi:hypothetical protein
MKDLIINYLKTSASGHVLGIILAAAAVLLGHSWLTEHDARMVAEQTVKTAQTQIDSLAKQSQVAAQVGQQQIAALVKQAAAVKTPAQAVQAIPALSDVPLNVRPAPGLPDAVTVDALPLFDELNKCKQTAVGLGVCTTRLDLQGKIDADKDTQITALKHKRGFWANVKTTAITVGIGAAIGYAAHR